MAFDTYYPDIALLLRANGSDGSTTFTDASMTPKTVTPSGNVQLDTAQSAYGGASILFDGSGDYLTAGLAADWTFLHDGTKWTLEMQFQLVNTGGAQVLMDTTASGQPGIYIFRNGVSGQLQFFMKGGGGADVLETSNIGGFPGSDGLFHHLRFTFDGTLASDQLKCWLDGTLLGSLDRTGSHAMTAPSNALRIGGSTAGSSWVNGWMDDIRITKGVVRNTTSFTPEESGDLAPSEGDILAAPPVPVVTARGGFGLRVLFPLSQLGLLFLGGGQMPINAPRPTITLRGAGRASVLGPQPVVIAAGHTGADSFAQLLAPSPVITARGGARAAVLAPAAVVTIEGTVVHFGRLQVLASPPVVLASGVFSSIGRMSARSAKPVVTARGAGRLAVTAPAPVLQASAGSGNVGRLLVVAPTPIVVFRDRVVSHGVLLAVPPAPALLHGGRARVLAPLPVVVAHGGPTVAIVYEAYAINLEMADKAGLVYPVSRYTNFPFDQVIRLKGNYYGVAADGLYLLGGATDHASPQPKAITYAWRTHFTDDDSPMLKTVAQAYLAGRIGAQATVTLIAGDSPAHDYAYDVRIPATARNYRQKFGLGIKTRYFGIGMRGAKELELDGVELDVFKMTRRLGK